MAQGVGEEKISLIQESKWSAGPRASRKLLNPGKKYYMNLAVRYVEAVNAMQDDDGIPVVRKAMIRCGLSLNTNGQWETTQLFQHLQDIIGRHPMEFAGMDVDENQ